MSKFSNQYYDPNHPSWTPPKAGVLHVHDWSDWKEIGRTGDWFHPLIVERKCKTCGTTETDEH